MRITFWLIFAVLVCSVGFVPKEMMTDVASYSLIIFSLITFGQLVFSIYAQAQSGKPIAGMKNMSSIWLPISMVMYATMLMPMIGEAHISLPQYMGLKLLQII